MIDITASTGPTNGAFVFTTGNIVFNWGVVAATDVGVTGDFAFIYTDGNPFVTLGVSGPTGAYISGVSKLGVKVALGTGATGRVNYIAVGT